MKIKTKKLDYDAVLALPRPVHKRPLKPSRFLAWVVKLASAGDLKDTDFTYETEGLEKVGDAPALILMNHSCFLDLMMANRIFYPKPYAIVCTGDGFVGKEWLMRRLGCVPTQKFVSDVTLIEDMSYLLHDKQVSVLMYPEASYSFDGTPTALPRKMGVLLKRLKVPVIMVKTQGAFARDPLYNCLQKRKVRVHAQVTCLLTPEQIQAMPVEELDRTLDQAFDFDHFAWQREHRISISEPFRADGLHRILYRCPHCGAEGRTEGKGVTLTCHACGKVWKMDEFGQLSGENSPTEFAHIPHWYAWERQEVRRELESGTYCLDTPVEIGMMVDYKAIYMVGTGHLRQDETGFHLTGCEGRLDYTQGPLASYSLYADYFWYELGDVICIGGGDTLYYCFPPAGVPVAKARLAAEELYKLKKRSIKKKSQAVSAL